MAKVGDGLIFFTRSESIKSSRQKNGLNIHEGAETATIIPYNYTRFGEKRSLAANARFYTFPYFYYTGI
jgi:hypothetical protein